MNCFMLTGKNKFPVASAFAPEEERSKSDHELISNLEGLNKTPFEFHLIKLTRSKKGLIKDKDLSGVDNLWEDYMLNQFAYNIFSARFKEVIEKELTGNEEINWITAKIHGNGECKTYYILRFTKKLDTINKEKSLFDKYGLIRPCFSSAKVEKYSIFHWPSSDYFWKIPSGVFVSEKLKKAIQKAKLTGVGFEKTEMS